MSIKAFHRAHCAVHGDNALMLYCVCVLCAEATRPNQVEDSKAQQFRTRQQRRRARLRMAKARAGKRSAAQERIEREARNSLAVV